MDQGPQYPYRRQPTGTPLLPPRPYYPPPPPRPTQFPNLPSSPTSQQQYQRFVAQFNRQAVLTDIRQNKQRFKLVPGDTHRLLTTSSFTEESEPSESEIAANRNWRLFQDSVRQNIVWKNVNKFIYKLKDLPVRRKPPRLVKEKLEPRIDKFWEDDTYGWNPWRPDVVFNDITHLVFNITAIFFFTTRTVLYKVDMGAFPLIYIFVLLINAFYRCNTRILYMQKVIVKRKKIIQHYLYNHAVLDGTIIYLCILQLCRVDTSWYRLIIFLKLLDNSLISKKLQQACDIIDYGILIFGLLRIYGNIILVSHCVALCFITMVSKDKHPNWMDEFGYTRDMDHWLTVYIRAYYWALSTLTLATFGDTTPQRTKEVIIVNLVQLFGISVVAYWLSALQTFFNAMRAKTLATTKNLRLMNRLLENNKVSYHIQKRVKETVYCMSKSLRVEDVEEENQLINSLSPWMRERLHQSIHTRPMMTMPLWCRFSMQSIKQITTMTQRKLFYGTELIIAQNQIPQRFFMLRNGRIYETYSNRTMHVTEVGFFNYIHGVADWFNRLQATIPSHYIWVGLDFTIGETESPVSVRSKNESLVISVEREKVRRVLREAEDETDYEGYCLFRDEMRFGMMNVHQVSCLHCPGSDHNMLGCPFYHYIPKKDLIIAKYIKRNDQRKKYRVKQRVLQPRVKAKQSHRRMRFPWVRIGERGNTVVGSLTENIRQRVNIEKYRGKRRLDRMAVNQWDVNEGLTTVRGVDSPYEWYVYFPKYNASKVTIN